MSSQGDDENESRYRVQNDVVAQTILESRSEGVGRIEIGKRVGINTKTKAGNRRVSGSIQFLVKTYPELIGQYQKVEGKYRMLKYYYKGEQDNPDAMVKLFNRIEELTNKPFPFKTGEVVKFPEEKLSTLRISDVTTRRMLFVLELMHEDGVIVTISRLCKVIAAKENELGYKFMVDKKSVLKVILAMQKKKMCRVLTKENVFEDDMMAVEDNESLAKAHTIQLVVPMDIKNTEDPRVRNAINKTIAIFQAEGRVFPTGHLRFVKKADQHLSEAIDIPLVDMTNLDFHDMSIAQRFSLLRFSFDASRKAKEKECEPQYDPNVFYGYQSKMSRCAMLHEFLFYIVHCLEETPAAPCIFHRFPPDKVLPPNERGHTPFNKIAVVDASPDTPYRFVSALPAFRDQQRGWFLLRDAILGMPVSLFCMIVNIKQRIAGLDELLLDPIQRHLPLGDLPVSVRRNLLTRKFCTAVEHVCLLLCATGHLRVAPSFDSGRSAIGPTALFCVGKKTFIYDTSTSERSYCTVTSPIERYERYDYEFKELNDVRKYWNHLKAIALSTPLNVRHLMKDEQAKTDKGRVETRKYASGCIDRTLFFHDLKKPVGVIEPYGDKTGCAGMDMNMFVHLQRHWEWNTPKNGEMVDWYIKRCQGFATNLAGYVEGRVKNLEKNWNSFVSCLLPTDMDLLKRKRQNMPVLSQKSLDAMSGNFRRHYSVRRSLNVPNETKRKSNTTTKALKVEDSRQDETLGKNAGPNRKRLMDKVDLESREKNMYIRSRFVTREYDMLILIRGVSFFLNPIHRFWLNATVMRDVMHEYVPESRCKTVSCLMAAGAREMVRPGRMSQLQYIVKTLASQPSMVEIRNSLTETNFTREEDKNKFFMDAFRKAYHFIFEETNTIPQISTSDSEFDDFMKARKLSVVISGNTNSGISFPRRSRAPETIDDIHHCVAFSVVMSSLITDTKERENMDKDSCFESLVNAVPAKSLTEALETGRSDGLITRIRNLEHTYRHFFNHTFRNDLIDMVQRHITKEGVCDVSDNENEENPVWVLQIVGHLYSANPEIGVSAPGDVDKLIGQPSSSDEKASVTKQLRHLESARLYLDNIKVTAVKQNERFSDVPSIDSVLPFIGAKYNLLEKPKQWEDKMKPKLPAEIRKQVTTAMVRSLLKTVRDSQHFGVPTKDLEVLTGFSRPCLQPLLDSLTALNLIFPCGVDTRRWVASEFAKPWLVFLPKFCYCIRPWSLPTGDVNWPVLRWMSEGVLMSTMFKPGMTLPEMKSTYGFVLPPVLLEELIQMLQFIGVLVVRHHESQSLIKKSPFDGEFVRIYMRLSDEPTLETVAYVVPTINAVERFAAFFKDVEPITTYFKKYDANYHTKK